MPKTRSYFKEKRKLSIERCQSVFKHCSVVQATSRRVLKKIFSPTMSDGVDKTKWSLAEPDIPVHQDMEFARDSIPNKYYLSDAPLACILQHWLRKHPICFSHGLERPSCITKLLSVVEGELRLPFLWCINANFVRREQVSETVGKKITRSVHMKNARLFFRIAMRRALANPDASLRDIISAPDLNLLDTTKDATENAIIVDAFENIFREDFARYRHDTSSVVVESTDVPRSMFIDEYFIPLAQDDDPNDPEFVLMMYDKLMKSRQDETSTMQCIVFDI